jgi:hypothetical protein
LNSKLKTELKKMEDQQYPAMPDHLLPESSSFDCCFFTLRGNSMSFIRLDVSVGFTFFPEAESPVGGKSCVLGREIAGEGGLEADPKPTLALFGVETGLGWVCVLTGRGGIGGLDC